MDSVSPQVFLVLITQWSRGSEKKKDIFSCIILCEIGVCAGLCFSLISPIIKWGYDYILLSTKVFHDFNQGIYYNVIQIPPLNFGIVAWGNIMIFAFITIVLFLVLLLLRIKRSLFFLVYVIIQVAVSVCLFDKVGYVLILFAVGLFILNIFIPFGSGAYFNTVKYASYLPELYRLNKKSEMKKSKTFLFIKIFVKLMVGGFLFAVSVKLLIPLCSLPLLMMMYASIILLILVNYSPNKFQMLIQKFFAYILIVFFVLANNNSFQSSFISLILAVISIFFAMDRVISLFKEYKDMVRQESLNYLIDEINEAELLLKEKLDILHVEQLDLPEAVLLRQIIIHYKLELPSVSVLISTYRNLGYKQESKLVDSMECLMMIDEDTSLEKQEEMLSKLWNNQDLGSEYLPLSVRYAYVLFLRKKDYEKIIEILKNHWLYLHDESKYVLYCAFKETNNLSAAKNVKNEILNFQQTEETMNQA